MQKHEILQNAMDRRREVVDFWNNEVAGKITSDMTTKQLVGILEVHQQFINQIWSAIEAILHEELDYKNPDRR